MNKSCFVLLAAVVSMSPASLFAGETMVTKTTTTSTGCDFRVDKCETSVAEDPSFIRFKDYQTIPGTSTVSPASGDPTAYRCSTTFQDYSAPPITIDELLAQIRAKLSNCPEVELSYDNTTGDLTLRYIHSACGCEWVVNIRDVKADDFVWKKTNDNYSNRLGQMERRKFHTANAKDAEDIQSDIVQILTINAWKATKD